LCHKLFVLNELTEWGWSLIVFADIY